MTASKSLSSVPTKSVSHNRHRNGVVGMSPRKFSERREVLSYRQQFAAIWRDFIHGNFESHIEVAFYFKVDSSTAEKWWSGSHAPQGWVIGKALKDNSLRASVVGILSEQS